MRIWHGDVLQHTLSRGKHMNKIKLLIVDDQEIIREGLQDIFLLDDDIYVVGLAVNGKKAIHYCETENPDIVLMDVHMPIWMELKLPKSSK